MTSEWCGPVWVRQEQTTLASSQKMPEEYVKINPLYDVWDFLVHGGPLGAIFWVLLLASIALAALNLARDPAQRSLAHLWNWFVRVSIAGLWWENSLWKAPPNYGVAADGSGGLRYWMQEMVQNSSTSLQSHLVSGLFLPHFALFAPQIYLAEVLVAVLLMLGLFSRVAAIVGALMALNLWLGLYRSPSEWIWGYFFLLVIQVTFLIVHPGRSWGADALLERQRPGRFDLLKRLG